MKILYLHQYFNLPNDPGGTRSYEMARRLVKAGHEVVMITSDYRQRFHHKGWKVTCEDGVQVHWLNVPYSNRLGYGARIKAFVRFAIGAALRAVRVHAHVVFATSTPLTIAIPGVWTAKRQHIPMVFEVRDLWPELPIAMGAIKGPLIPMAKGLAYLAYRNATRVVALSPDMAKGVEKWGYPATNITVIPNACDIALFHNAHEVGAEFRRRHNWLQDRPLVVYTGTIGRINGVDYLVKLAAEVAQKDSQVRFLLVGEGAEEDKVRQVAKDFGVFGQNFFMIPPVPKKRMPEILGAATVSTSLFIDLPEMWANSANKFFDALAAGTPVAINYKGWQAEVLQRTGAGIVLSPNDISHASYQLLKFLHDREQLENARKAAKALAETEFNRDHLTMRLERILQEAVDEFGQHRKELL